MMATIPEKTMPKVNNIKIKLKGKESHLDLPLC
jgi:hypothetical protein